MCHLLPGPEAQQLATWIGWKLHGWQGGLVAGALFVIPGALVMLALSMLYALAADLDWFAALFLGIKAAVLAIIAQALLRIAGRALKTPFQRGLAVAAFVALFLFDAPFPLVVLAALALGALVGAKRPDWLALKPRRGRGRARIRGRGRPASRRSLVWLAIWAAPMAAVVAVPRPRPRAVGHRRVLLAARGGHLRRRLRGARLYGAGGGQRVRLAQRRARWPTGSGSPKPRPGR